MASNDMKVTFRSRTCRECGGTMPSSDGTDGNHVAFTCDDCGRRVEIDHGELARNISTI